MSPEKQETGPEFSAKQLALLQFYATTIEGLLIMIYRSDPVKYDKLLTLAQLTIRELQALAKQRTEFRTIASDCDPGETRCTDGLCHPANDPTCCEISIPTPGAELS